MNQQVVVLLDDDFDENEIFTTVLSQLDVDPFYRYFRSWENLLDYLTENPDFQPTILFIDAYVGNTVSEFFIPSLRSHSQTSTSKIVVYSLDPPLASLQKVMMENHCEFILQSSSIGQYSMSVNAILQSDH